MSFFENEHPNLVLGSASPRRHELFHRAGLHFTVRTAETGEHFPPEMPGILVPEYLARVKSGAVIISDDELLVTADTVVCLDDQVLNKAANAGEASQMLQSLSGREHLVHTGVCLRQGERIHSFTESTQVFFRTLSDAEINYYIREYQPFDKAGAYGIQEWIGLVGVSRIEGCYENVVGFPMSRFLVELREFTRNREA